MVSPIVTADGSCTLSSLRYGETYHSIKGAYTESHHVFLEASGVKARLAKGKHTQVLEIGFGLGLNALLTADIAMAFNAPLDYHAFEHELVEPAVIEQMGYASLLQFPDMLNQVLSGISAPPANSATGNLSPCEINLAGLANSGAQRQTVAGAVASGKPSCDLTIHRSDATNAPFPDLLFHAIYLDAFSPECNGACWTVEFFEKLASVLIDDGLLTTYSAKGQVRRNMLAAGLAVEKRPGPPGKREMLVAKLQ